MDLSFHSSIKSLFHSPLHLCTSITVPVEFLYVVELLKESQIKLFSAKIQILMFLLLPLLDRGAICRTL